MKLRVVQGEKFSCHSCTICCRGWHVELLPHEIASIPALRWREGDPLRDRGAAVLERFAGKTVLAHKENTACVFLNEENGRCRIHEQFGEAAKPLGCRLFPFHITPTFRNEASATARYDCPTVRKNEGAPHEEQRASLEGYAREMHIPSEGFDEKTRCFLEREQIEAVADFAATLLKAFERDDQRAIFILLLSGYLTEMKVGDLDRTALGNAFTPLKEAVEATTTMKAKPPNSMHRLAFRTLLALHLRRDEDILNAKRGRIRRALAMTAVVLGHGGFRGLGAPHRPGKLRRARLFRHETEPLDPALMEPLWRLVRAKLGSFQFMGRGNGGRDFLAGLRSLAMLYPLVLAVAKYSAANRNSPRIEANDIDYAVASIEHNFGKLAILNQPLARQLEVLLMDPMTFVRVARWV